LRAILPAASGGQQRSYGEGRWNGELAETATTAHSIPQLVPPVRVDPDAAAVNAGDKKYVVLYVYEVERV